MIESWNIAVRFEQLMLDSSLPSQQSHISSFTLDMDTILGHSVYLVTVEASECVEVECVVIVDITHIL